MLTRAEIRSWLNETKWILLDLGYTALAGQYEDAERRLDMDDLGLEGCLQYAAYLFPGGKRGQARLALSAPEEARGLVVLAALVRAWGGAA